MSHATSEHLDINPIPATLAQPSVAHCISFQCPESAEVSLLGGMLGKRCWNKCCGPSLRRARRSNSQQRHSLLKAPRKDASVQSTKSMKNNFKPWNDSRNEKQSVVMLAGPAEVQAKHTHF
eukprot:4151391-Amphidinium_carterae.1